MNIIIWDFLYLDCNTRFILIFDLRLAFWIKVIFLFLPRQRHHFLLLWLFSLTLYHRFLPRRSRSRQALLYRWHSWYCWSSRCRRLFMRFDMCAWVTWICTIRCALCLFCHFWALCNCSIYEEVLRRDRLVVGHETIQFFKFAFSSCLSGVLDDKVVHWIIYLGLAIRLWLVNTIMQRRWLLLEQRNPHIFLGGFGCLLDGVDGLLPHVTLLDILEPQVIIHRRLLLSFLFSEAWLCLSLWYSQIHQVE